jgi:hypothetical protein
VRRLVLAVGFALLARSARARPLDAEALCDRGDDAYSAALYREAIRFYEECRAKGGPAEALDGQARAHRALVVEAPGVEAEPHRRETAVWMGFRQRRFRGVSFGVAPRRFRDHRIRQVPDLALAAGNCIAIL